MLLYGCFNIDISGPQTQYLKTFPTFSREAELQPQRASRTLSCPQTRCFGVCSFNARRRREAGQGGRWGCGPEQLAATVPCALFTADVSQWRGAHSVFCDILEHSGCTGGFPEALYLKLYIFILYIDIYHIIYVITTKSCAPTYGIMNLKRLRRLWFFHVHINLK